MGKVNKCREAAGGRMVRRKERKNQEKNDRTEAS